MPKAIRLKMFQQMPNYKKPLAVVLKESFPLPPYSSVIGMIHTVCGWTDGTYHPMKISIQGKHFSDIAEIETQYVFGQPYESGRHTYKISNSKNDKGDGLLRSPKTIQFLTDVELCIHIIPDDETEIEHIYNNLLNPPEYISLGRREDIARIDEVVLTKLENITDDDIQFDLSHNYEFYCPVKYVINDKTDGTIYKIPKTFGYDDKKKTRRIWKEIIKSIYSPTCELNNCENMLSNKNVFYDDCDNGTYLVIMT